MEDQRRPSRATGYPASADTECGGAVAAAGPAQRRLGLREKPARTERNPASAVGRGRRAFAAADEKFGRSTGHSAPADMEAAGPSLPSNGIGLAAASAGSQGLRRIPGPSRHGGPPGLGRRRRSSVARGTFGLSRHGGRRSFTAVEQDRFGFSLGRKAGLRRMPGPRGEPPARRPEPSSPGRPVGPRLLPQLPPQPGRLFQHWPEAGGLPSATADMQGRRSFTAVERDRLGFSLGRKPAPAASHPVPAGQQGRGFCHNSRRSRAACFSLGRKPGGSAGYPVPTDMEGRRVFAAGDEKFGRSAEHSATADMEGRRPFTAVERDRFRFSLGRKPDVSAGYPAPADMEGRRAFAAVERD
ncbi:hypothetical protein HRG_007165 [Hirsutella rhossiliensis]|uniref:Uncharacterized protein n=1 Tax=Hirsutella rhossiliensis TaxID=111463 RepID=A0A9P8MVN2_9HYPO|nr:uncharacterized protein HRG_07165 [Hirsutella rhossiliensis]KAH0962085.1 hypothetical protein HRG_07165 [Hirsutella rhossiliensis]